MIDTFEDVEGDASRALATGLRALLRGRAPDDETSDALALAHEVSTSIPEGVPIRGRLLHLVAHGRTLPARVSAARAASSAAVHLHDGSALTKTEAERLLVHKEEKGAFAPLREAIDDATAEAREEEADADEERERFLAGEVGTAHPEVDEEAARSLLDDVQPALQTLADAAGAAVFSVPPDAVAWASALDPTFAHHFLPDAQRALVRAALAAAGETGRPVRAVAAPQALAGWMSPTAADAVRAAMAEGVGAGCARDNLAAAGRALGHAVAGEPGREESLDALGGAIGRALGAAHIRRAVLATSRRDAERAERTGVVCESLRLFLTAAAARALLDGADLEEAEEALHQAAGAVLPRSALGALLRGPWPEGDGVDSRLGGLLRRLRGALAGARVEQVLRERFDERFAIEPALYRWLEAVPGEARTDELGLGEWSANALVERASELL